MGLEKGGRARMEQRGTLKTSGVVSGELRERFLGPENTAQRRGHQGSREPGLPALPLSPNPH